MDVVVRADRISVAGRAIGAGARCFVIAEAGVNHDGEVETAHKLVDAAADAGADAVKFQTFDPETLAAAAAPKAEYQLRDNRNETQLEMLTRLALPRDAYRGLSEHAQARGLVFLSSPFDEGSADVLEALDVAAFKIPSGELTNPAFLAHVARKTRPMLVSTGMSTLAEVREAVDTIHANGAPPLALFHCVSSYPALATDANLRAMETLRRAIGVPVGWSDHTEGIDVAIAAAALGAELLEKHLTLDRNTPGPDHRASIEPAELKALVRGVRNAQAALGTGEKMPAKAERAISDVSRKSLHWRASLPPGTRVRLEHLIALRPGTGLPPSLAPSLVGKVLSVEVAERTLVDPAAMKNG